MFHWVTHPHMSNFSPGSQSGTVMLLFIFFLEALPGGNGSMWLLLILLFTTLGVMDEEALSQHMLTPLFFPSHVRCLRDTPASLCLETVPALRASTLSQCFIKQTRFCQPRFPYFSPFQMFPWLWQRSRQIAENDLC